MKKMISNFSALILLILSGFFSYKNLSEYKLPPNEINFDNFTDSIWVAAFGDLMCHTPQIKVAKLHNGKYDFRHMFDIV